VFEEVGETRPTSGLVHGAYVIPKIDSDDWESIVFVQNDLEPIIEAEFLDLEGDFWRVQTTPGLHARAPTEGKRGGQHRDHRHEAESERIRGFQIEVMLHGSSPFEPVEQFSPLALETAKSSVMRPNEIAPEPFDSRA
jgi:hypothetical protein